MVRKFNAVAWMRQRRIEIDQQTEGLTWRERQRHILASLENDPLWERIKERAKILETSGPMISSAKETPPAYDSEKESAE